ncbi:MAG: GAF domain-containing protein, partial [Cyanobacteria bacterium P01_G01_bin.19]
ANLVTPILNEGKLFGLLVAHQCSQPRHWQDYEIRWVTQIATQVGFALDNASLLQRSQETGLPTQLLNNFSFGISERVNKLELLKIAVEQARKVIKLDRVIVYQFDHDWNGNIVAESVIPGYPRALNSQITDPCFAREYAEKYRQGRTYAINNVYQANLTSCHLEQLEPLSVKASVVVPILQNEELFGLLIGHQCQQPRQWLQSEIDLFAQLAIQLGLALDRAILQEQLDAAKNVKLGETTQQLPAKQDFNREISQLLLENQAALRDLRAKIDKKTGSFSPQQLYYREIDNKPKNMQIDNEVAAAQRAIAEATKKVEVLNQSHQNLHQMVAIIDNLKQKMDRSSQLPRLPMGEIAIESSEAILEPIDDYDRDLYATTEQLAEDSNTPPNLLMMNQFIGDITDLSDKISQQSSIVTDSFQKLAEFAQQLSEDREQ